MATEAAWLNGNNSGKEKKEEEKRQKKEKACHSPAFSWKDLAMSGDEVRVVDHSGVGPYNDHKRVYRELSPNPEAILPVCP